eukprot:1293558-Karenia_brevis.AAC.1
MGISSIEMILMACFNGCSTIPLITEDGDLSDWPLSPNTVLQVVRVRLYEAQRICCNSSEI